jgi:(1->4)-alpha-D-glucan 1-alpha-D-glucosylmutase
LPYSAASRRENTPGVRDPQTAANRKRGALLDELRRSEAQDLPALVRELTGNWQDGRIKLYVTYKALYKALTFRRAHPELFQRGDYLPAPGGERVCAFARRLESRWALVVAPRLVASAGRPPRRLLPQHDWGDAALDLPSGAPRRWRNVFTGEIAGPGLADLLARFPVGLFEPGE